MEHNLAVLIDFENLATGCEKEGLGRFDLRAVMRRMKDKGRILVARAYADWGQWNRAKHDLFEQGVQMVEMSTRGSQAKNRADMALCVDAMELAFTREFVDTFVILSGDSDFTPLVTRLKELNKRVIGCGTRGSSSQVFSNLCDEFLFYETIKKQLVEAETDDAEEEPANTRARPPSQERAFKLLVETLENLQRDEASSVHGSVIKSSIKRKVPTFNEVELGFRTFTRFLESAADRGLISLSRDERAGGYRVELGAGRRADATSAESEARPDEGAPRRPDLEAVEGGRAEGGRSEGGRSEGGRSEGGRGEGGRGESGRGEGGRGEGARPDGRRRRRRRGGEEPPTEVAPLRISRDDPMAGDDLPPDADATTVPEEPESPPEDVLEPFYEGARTSTSPPESPPDDQGAEAATGDAEPTPGAARRRRPRRKKVVAE